MVSTTKGRLFKTPTRMKNRFDEATAVVSGNRINDANDKKEMHSVFGLLCGVALSP